ncbi:hypothetical protein AB1Y20_021192 [Prymnesium parvum]|uniref:Uncharacterized protein n=1 Tax=Prymnesium parvum TaxID=97485 RepID=A0AB34JKN8_PRYPA
MVASQALAAEIQAAGEPIPGGAVAALATQVAEVSGQKPPSTIALKRTFITNWFNEVGRKALGELENLSVRDPSEGAQGGSRQSPASSNTHAEPVNRERLLQQLNMYGAELIPAAQLGEIAARIELLEGDKAPKSVQQKRAYIQDWHSTHGDENGVDTLAGMEERTLQMPPPPPPHLPQPPSAPLHRPHGQGHVADEPSAAAGLVMEVNRAYTDGATEQQLHAIAAAVSVFTGVPMPQGSVADLGEYVLDFHNWGRHMVSPQPAPLRPGVRGGTQSSASASRAQEAAPPRAPQPHSPQQHLARGYGDALVEAPAPLLERPTTAPAEQGAARAAPPPHVHEESERGDLRTPRNASVLLAQLDSLTGGDPAQDLPIAQLNSVAKHVSKISARKVPSLLAQKRQFVRAWHIDARAGAGKQMNRNGAPSKAQMSASEIYAEIEARLLVAQRSITQSEIPELHVDLIAGQVAGLLNIDMPTLLRDRRHLIEKWHAQHRRTLQTAGRR